MKELTDLLLIQINELKLSEPVQEFKFHPVRKWRFDLAFVDKKLAVECDGGTWTGGRHTTGAGFQNDCMKFDEAMRLGWNVYRCTGEMIKSGRAVKTIEALLKL
jgi:very-short-patch-repair endonuclease